MAVIRTIADSKMERIIYLFILFRKIGVVLKSNW